MSTTAYDLQWVTPTAQPYTGTITASTGGPATDRSITQMLDEMTAAGDGATDSRIYATYYREAHNRGLTQAVSA